MIGTYLPFCKQPEEKQLLAQNLLHRFPFREFIDQLVQVAYVLHQRIFDFFHANPAHHTFDKRAIWMHGWRLRKEGRKIIFLFNLLMQPRLTIAS